MHSPSVCVSVCVCSCCNYVCAYESVCVHVPVCVCVSVALHLSRTLTMHLSQVCFLCAASCWAEAAAKIAEACIRGEEGGAVC